MDWIDSILRLDIFNFTRLPALSSFAANVDGVIGWVTVAVGFWFILTEVVFFYFILKYRKKNSPKAAYITGEEPDLKRWITRPHNAILVFDVLIVIIGVSVWVDVKQTLPAEPVPHIRVVAQQWAWSFVHPGPDGLARHARRHQDGRRAARPGRTRPYVFKLEARDVLHSFSVPVFRLKQDAIPGRVITGWFEANADRRTTTSSARRSAASATA